MFAKLKRFFRGEPPPVVEKIDDPVLGTLTWSKDDEAWVSSATHAGVGFEFQISGTPEPDRALLAHAADILGRKDDFAAEVLAYAKSEGETVRSLRSYRDEIAGLRVERVCLLWSDRPDDGMISLSGGRDYRLWRCDYIARKPKGLGFDS
jgi:hypothetical protein